MPPESDSLRNRRNGHGPRLNERWTFALLAEKGLHTIKYWKQEQPRTMFERPSRPVIEYPCPWEYKVIGENESAMRQAVADVMIDINHKVTFSHTSRTGSTAPCWSP